jgi:hypothetical protein
VQWLSGASRGFGAAGTLLGTYIQRFIDRLDIGDAPEPLTEEEAETQARSRLCRHYEVGFNALSLISVDSNLESNEATVEMRGPDGSEYAVEMKRARTHIVVSRVYRKRPQ